MRVIVLGYIVRGPLGGLAWHHLQYAVGLARLGHDVFFLEHGDDYASCYDPSRELWTTDPSYGLRFAASAFRRVGLGTRWAYHDAHTGSFNGPAGQLIRAQCERADVIVNVSGANALPPWCESAPVRVLVDTDPAFTQIRHLTDAAARARSSRHNAFFSFAENVGGAGCRLPDDGFPWRPTRQPIVLDLWRVTAGSPDGRFTSVMQWDSYSPREYAGMRYGMKSQSFREFLDLPQQVGGNFELALGNRAAPLELLMRKGWLIRDASSAARDPWSYQRYIRRSAAEFGVAKHGYVISRSGWFSERSAAYLASGRPVLAQDTGFSTWLQADAGVVPFGDRADARRGVEDIRRRYGVHSAAARTVAEEYFDHRKVLSSLLERAVTTAGLDASRHTSLQRVH